MSRSKKRKLIATKLLWWLGIIILIGLMTKSFMYYFMPKQDVEFSKADIIMLVVSISIVFLKPEVLSALRKLLRNIQSFLPKKRSVSIDEENYEEH